LGWLDLFIWSLLWFSISPATLPSQRAIRRIVYLYNCARTYFQKSV